MHAGDTGLFVIADGASCVDRVAVTGIGVSDDRQLGGINDATGVVDHFGCGEQTDIRHAQPCQAGAETGHVHRFKTFHFHQPRGKGVGDPGGDEAAGACQQGA